MSQSSRNQWRDSIVGLALILGAAIGAAIGVIVAGGTGIALGSAFGAGMGIVLGAIARSFLASDSHEAQG